MKTRCLEHPPADQDYVYSACNTLSLLQKRLNEQPINAEIEMDAWNCMCCRAIPCTTERRVSCALCNKHPIFNASHWTRNPPIPPASHSHIHTHTPSVDTNTTQQSIDVQRPDTHTEDTHEAHMHICGLQHQKLKIQTEDVYSVCVRN